MRYTCKVCSKIIEDDSFCIQAGVIIEHERTHKEREE